MKIATTYFPCAVYSVDCTCLATTQTAFNCTYNWVQHAGNSNKAAYRANIYSLARCQQECGFNPRCSVDWLSNAHNWRYRQCWITTDPNHGHYINLTPAWRTRASHYHLVNRCNVRRGQCFHDIHFDNFYVCK